MYLPERPNCAASSTTGRAIPMGRLTRPGSNPGASRLSWRTLTCLRSRGASPPGGRGCGGRVLGKGGSTSRRWPKKWRERAGRWVIFSTKLYYSSICILILIFLFAFSYFSICIFLFSICILILIFLFVF